MRRTYHALVRVICYLDLNSIIDSSVNKMGMSERQKHPYRYKQAK